MAEKRLASVGYILPGFDCLPLKSKSGLLDYDIILVAPLFDEFENDGQFQGKLSYVDNSAFELRESVRHWRAEIKSAFDSGKTIVVFLPEYYVMSVDTGKREYSGTGRNRHTTRLLGDISNYEIIPFKLRDVRNSEGKLFRNCKNTDLVQPIIDCFEGDIKYLVHYELSDGLEPLLLTRDGSKVVASILRSKGNIFFLPFPQTEWEEMLVGDTGEEVWNQSANELSSKFIKSLVVVHQKLQSLSDFTPTPDWAKENRYRLRRERDLENSILETESKIDDLKFESAKRNAALDEYLALKELLFGKGKKLEEQVGIALGLLGIKASGYSDGDSEFDLVFSLEGKRFIGEVEGKDGSAIDINKFSQLERNIHEELAKSESDEPAIGILFGNAFRLLEPEKRKDFFTAKVIASAKRNGTRLVKTSDLFNIANHIRDTGDIDYAASCRAALVSQVGKIVEFPQVESSVLAENVGDAEAVDYLK
jgi:hypothetical protein